MFNAMTADVATGLSTAICKDGQTACTARIPFANGIDVTLTTNSTSVSTGGIITAGGLGVAKDFFLGGFMSVGVASSATGIIKFKGTTSGTVTLSVADAAGTWTLKLPTGAGTANYLLSTDGSGNTSWVAPATGVTYSAQGSNFTAAVNTAYWITANSVVITLPAAPADNDFVAIAESNGSTGVTGCSIARNGNKIMGLSADMTLDTINFHLKLTYRSSTTDWRLTV